MSIEQSYLPPTEAEIVAERTRLVQNFVIAIGLMLDRHATEGTTPSNGGDFKTAYFADPEWSDYWKLEYSESREGELSYSAIKLRTSKLVHATPNEHCYFASDGKVMHSIGTRRTSSGANNHPEVDDNTLIEMEKTVLRLTPLRFSEEQFVMRSEQALGR